MRLSSRASRSPMRRSVTRAALRSAERAQRRSFAGVGSSAQRVAYWTVRASSGFRPGLRFGVPLISIDDALHERVAHHVARLKIGKGDAAHALQYDARLDEPAFVAARQVDLRNVAGNDRFAAETDACQEHFHLFRRRVLRF